MPTFFLFLRNWVSLSINTNSSL